MSNDNKQLVYRWFEEVWNDKNRDSIAKMFAIDGVAHGLGSDGASLIGPGGFQAFQEAFVSAFPNLLMTVEDVIAEDDKVAVRWKANGNLQGTGLGVAATGKSMTVTGMSIVRVRDGMIVEGWTNFDLLGLHQQVGTLAQLIKQ